MHLSRWPQGSFLCDWILLTFMNKNKVYSHKGDKCVLKSSSGSWPDLALVLGQAPSPPYPCSQTQAKAGQLQGEGQSQAWAAPPPWPCPTSAPSEQMVDAPDGVRDQELAPSSLPNRTACSQTPEVWPSS